MLSKLSTSDVLLRLNDPSRAIIIEPVDSDAEITGLLMPMLVNE
jgi:DNA polymerase III sliding clamp (beta) subunit (PCNA family)